MYKTNAMKISENIYTIHKKTSYMYRPFKNIWRISAHNTTKYPIKRTDIRMIL